MGDYKKPSSEEIKKKLTREQFEVTQCDATERAFDNPYWNHHEAGIYVDIVTGEPLFSSMDKYDSGTGWPSFSKPMDKDHLIERIDRSIPFMERTEVRSKQGDSHLGHVFPDERAATGLRYCMNSAALKFVPVEKLKEEGYENYLSLFRQEK